ncbi:MAG: ATP-binding protein [Burkholderiales bacterium]
MKSLKTQLSIGLAGSLVLLLGLQWFLVSTSIEDLLENQLEERLTRDAESLLAGLSLDAQGAMQIDPRRVNPVYQRPFSGHYYFIRAGDDEQVSRSLWDSELEIPTVQAGTGLRLTLPGPEQQVLFTVAHGYVKQGRAFTIAVAQDLTSLSREIAVFRLRYGIVSALVLIVLLLVQRYIVRGGLRPLDTLRSEVSRLEQGEIDRVSMSAPEEIAPLVSELNRLLAALSNRTRRSRVALGNLAHALKTQLAILTQVAARPELHRAAELRKALTEPIETSRRIVERELRRARLAGSAMPGRRVPLEKEIASISGTLSQLYPEKNLRIATAISPDAVFHGDREDLLELLGNLLDNACKWSSGRVSLTIGNGDGIAFVVEDDGPGCDDVQLEELTRRGFRADESKPGSGLGLAIVKDVVESYGGSLTFGRSAALGGLRVEARLPVSDPVGTGDR